MQLIRAPASLLALLLLAGLAGCGDTETVTVTTTQVVTETVEKTETVTVTVQAETTTYVPQAAGSPEFRPDQLSGGASGGGWVIKKWISYGGEIAGYSITRSYAQPGEGRLDRKRTRLRSRRQG